MMVVDFLKLREREVPLRLPLRLPLVALGKKVMGRRDIAAAREIESAEAMDGMFGVLKLEDGGQFCMRKFMSCPGWRGRAGCVGRGG
jgi:hypothetical protein